jgi:2,4-dienoyl-CoA reductase-like NADH-dependent reductase (Old Yellow Enzyme family)
MWMREEIITDLKKLTDAVHNEGAAASVQLGHCGYFASRSVIGTRPLGASPQFNLFRLSYCRAMKKEDIRQKTHDFVNAAVMAREAGFDAVEVHAGHGYLLSQFMSPYTNHRKDDFGGSLENRMRFPTEVIRKIRDRLGSRFPILVKMNLFDGMKRGLQLEEAIEAARLFEKAGASAIIPSCGFTSKTPLYMLRGNVPVLEMVKNQKSWLRKMGLFLFGKSMVQHYPYEELFLVEHSLQLKDAISIPVIYIGGVKSGTDVRKVLDMGFDFVQVGRALIHNPDFVQEIQSNAMLDPLCDHCNRCVAAMDGGGVYCVSREKGYLKGKE